VIDRLIAVERALTESGADVVPERLADVLAKEYGVSSTEFYLVDYQLSALLPASGGEPRTRPGDPAWRCFDHQEDVHEDATVYLPVTARGERLGVLACGPEPGDGELRAELSEIATLLAHAIQSAEKGTDRYRVAARTRRLTLAAEMQWELLPGRSRTRPDFALAGQLEPAYAVRGDSFDWAEQDGHLYLSVLGGMGDGVSASALTALAVYALRNARRAGIPLADQAALADQAIFAEHRGAKYVLALMLRLDLTTGELVAVDAGSPSMLLIRDGVVVEQPLEDQDPLGMFEDTDYAEQRLRLRPGDRLVIVSDGVSEAIAQAGRYGEAALARFLRRAQPMAPLQAVRSLLGDLRSFLGDADLDDDAVAVCLDYKPGARGTVAEA
jgi:serine phosphatase RsbU (regulator of sigma subunit)